MRRYVILHINPELNTEAPEGDRFDALIEASTGNPIPAIELGLYQPVCAVDANDTEHLFEITQSSDAKAWHDEVPIVHGRSKLRSTGLGDIAIDYTANKVMLCTPSTIFAFFGGHAEWPGSNDDQCALLIQRSDQFLRNVSPN